MIPDAFDEIGAGSAPRCASLPTRRSVLRCLLLAVLVGYLVVRYAIRQYVRKELVWSMEIHGD